MLESHKGLNWTRVVSVEVEFRVKRCVAKLNEPSLNISLSLIFDSHFISYFFFLNSFLFPHQTSITQNTADVIFQKEEKKGKKEESVIPCVREKCYGYPKCLIFERTSSLSSLTMNFARPTLRRERAARKKREAVCVCVCVCVCVNMCIYFSLSQCLYV